VQVDVRRHARTELVDHVLLTQALLNFLAGEVGAIGMFLMQEG
jgi:hypothetical protein